MELNNTPVLLRPLEVKYGISDQTLNNRLKYLKIQPFKQYGDKRKSYIYQYQVEILDALHEHSSESFLGVPLSEQFMDLGRDELRKARYSVSVDTPYNAAVSSMRIRRS